MANYSITFSKKEFEMISELQDHFTNETIRPQSSSIIKLALVKLYHNEIENKQKRENIRNKLISLVVLADEDDITPGKLAKRINKILEEI